MKAFDWAKWSALAEIVSSVAIVVTLVYLTVQTEQNTDAILASSRQAVIANDLQGLASGIENPGIEHSMYKPDLTDDEKVQLEWWLIGLVRMREYQWLQYQNGLLDAQTWNANLPALSRNLSFPRTRGWWNLMAIPYFDDDFVADVNAYLKDFPIIDNYVHPFDQVDAAH